MKQAKKLASLLLALVMVLSLATTAFADGETTTGSITINKAVPGENYNVYKILTLESYNKTTNSYSYKAANTQWSAFLNGTDIKDVYVKIDSQGYVTWMGSADAATFAKKALAYAKDNSIAKTGKATCASDATSVTIGNLELGYYLVDSSLGALCGLDTTNPNFSMDEKNEKPTVDKTVTGGSATSDSESNVAQVGDTVNFKIVVHAKKGAENYVLHDKMSDGLDLVANSIKVKVGETEVDGTNYTLHTPGTEDTNKCTFEIEFENTYLATLDPNTDITVTYSAVVNEKAIVANAGNNKAKLDYGDDSKTTWDETNTTTYEFDIVKTNSELQLLAGAKFELYDAQTAGNKIKLVKVDDWTYRVANATEAANQSIVSAVIETKGDKPITVKGLGSKTYWLEETKAPDGFNQLAGRKEVTFTQGSNKTTMTGTTWAEGQGGVQITNQSGTLLPSTGGIGTTIFYVLGSVLVIGAAVLLVTKKRMGAKD